MAVSIERSSPGWEKFADSRSFYKAYVIRVESIRGFTSLYVELALLAVVVSISGAIVSFANSVSTSIGKFEAPPRMAAYLVYNKTVVVSWDDRLLRVELVCPGLGSVGSIEVARGTHIINYTCGDLVLVVSGYVVKPLRVL